MRVNEVLLGFYKNKQGLLGVITKLLRVSPKFISQVKNKKRSAIKKSRRIDFLIKSPG